MADISDKTYGPMTKDQFMRTVSKDPAKATDALKQSSTVFSWQPQDEGYWQTRDGSVKTPMPQSGQGSSVFSAQPKPQFNSPIQLKEAVKSISSSKVDEPSFVDTLTPEAKRVYERRMARIDKRNVVTKTIGIAGDLLSDAFADPLTKIVDKGVNKILEPFGKETPRKQLAEQMNVLEQKISDLTDKEQFDDARKLYDEYMKIKIDGMSDKDILRAGTEHPILFDLTNDLAVGSMQFLALRNAPFIKILGDTMKAKATAQFGKTAITTSNSKFVRGLTKMATELAGDLPAEFLMPVMNFDYDKRPITELPKQIVKDLSILVPATTSLHIAGAGAGALGGGVLRAAGTVAAMLRSLRVPLSDGATKAFEQAVMDEADNAFSRIISQLPEEKQILQDHFKFVRQSAIGENRLLTLMKKSDPTLQGENRLAGLKTVSEGITPPDNNFIKKSGSTGAFDESAKLDGITNEEASFMTRPAPTRKNITPERMAKIQENIEAKATLDKVVSEVSQFREGLKQGAMQTKDDVRIRQSEMEELIKTSIPAKYRSRALGLIRRSATPAGFEKATAKLEELVQEISVNEMKPLAKQGSIKRSTRKGIMETLNNPVPEIDVYQSPERAIWFNSMLPASTAEKAGEAASEFMRLMVDEFEPVNGLKQTKLLLKQYPKITTQKIQKSWEDLANIYNKYFTSKQEVDAYHRYAYLKQMRSREVLGLSNPSVPDLQIPPNVNLSWIDEQLALMDSPVLQAAHADLKKWDDTYILGNLLESGRVTPSLAKEWREKYPDHLTFMYDKYVRTEKGNPFQKSSYNFSTRDYLSPIKGGEGLQARANIFDTRMRSAMRTISDLYTDQIASSIRNEMGISPVKIVESPTGRRKFQAIIKGQLHEFDAKDLESESIEGLAGQRIMYSSVDDQAFLVPKKIHDVISNINQGMGPVQRAFARMTGFWRDFTTTYNPIFAAVTNPSRDLQNAIALTDHSVKDFLGAYLMTARDLLASSIYKDPNLSKLDLDKATMGGVQQKMQTAMNWLARKIGTNDFEGFNKAFTESGGAQGGYYAFQETLKDGPSTLDSLKSWVQDSDPQFSLAKVNTRFIENGVIRRAYQAKNVMAIPFKSVEELGSFFEKLPRGAEFRLAMESTGNEAYAVGRASDISVDFHKNGAFFKMIKNAFPFSNARIQGTVNLLSAATGTRGIPQAGVTPGINKLPNTMASAALFSSRIAAQIIAPAAGLWWWRKQTGVEDAIDDQTRDNYWTIPTGSTWTDQYGNTVPVVVTVRKGEAAQMLSPVIDGILNSWYSQDPTAFQSLEPQNLVDSLMASVTAFIRVPVEVSANHSFYYKAPIEDPLTLGQRPKELRAYKSTTALGKRVADMTGLSPVEADYVLRNMLPAPMTFYRAMTQEVEPGKNIPLTLAEILNVVQTPSTYFEDEALRKKQRDILTQMKNMGRARYATTEERTAAQQRLLRDLYEVSDIIKAKDKISQDNPLQGLPIEFTMGTPDERKAMWSRLSPDQKKDAIRRGYVTPLKK